MRTQSAGPLDSVFLQPQSKAFPGALEPRHQFLERLSQSRPSAKAEKRETRERSARKLQQLACGTREDSKAKRTAARASNPFVTCFVHDASRKWERFGHLSPGGSMLGGQLLLVLSSEQNP